MVEFADFLCPHCRHASPTFKSFAQSRPDVRLVFMAFPLDGQCNAAITQQGDGVRCKIAKVVHCAQKQGKGWEAFEWGMESFNPGIDAFNVANEIGIDRGQLEACVNDAATHEDIMKQAAVGATAGVKGTPTVYVNGKKLEAAQIRLVLEQTYQAVKSGK